MAGSIPCSRIVVHQVAENSGFHPLTTRLHNRHRSFIFVSEEPAMSDSTVRIVYPLFLLLLRREPYTLVRKPSL